MMANSMNPGCCGCASGICTFCSGTTVPTSLLLTHSATAPFRLNSPFFGSPSSLTVDVTFTQSATPAAVASCTALTISNGSGWWNTSVVAGQTWYLTLTCAVSSGRVYLAVNGWKINSTTSSTAAFDNTNTPRPADAYVWGQGITGNTCSPFSLTTAGFTGVGGFAADPATLTG